MVKVEKSGKDIVKDYIEGIFKFKDLEKIARIFARGGRGEVKVFPRVNELQRLIRSDLGVEVTIEDIANAWNELKDKIYNDPEYVNLINLACAEVKKRRRKREGKEEKPELDFNIVFEGKVGLPILEEYNWEAIEKEGLLKKITIHPMVWMYYWLTRALGLHDWDITEFINNSVIMLWHSVYGLAPILAKTVEVMDRQEKIEENLKKIAEILVEAIEQEEQQS